MCYTFSYVTLLPLRMKNPLLNSGKFWLKTVVTAVILLVCTAAALYASVYALFTPERIETTVQNAFSGTGRNIRFSSDIRRSWFPRPTVTLKNVTITRPHSNQTALHIKETRIGLGWSSLWNDYPFIEKWVITGADAVLSRTEDGKWNLQDLLHPSHPTSLNRLIIENSSLHMNIAGQAHIIDNFYLNVRNDGADGRPFKINGSLRRPNQPIQWQGSGVLNASETGWSIPNLLWEASVAEKESKLSVDGSGTWTWSSENDSLKADNLSLRTDNPAQNFHLTAQIPRLSFKNNVLNIPSLNGAFTAGKPESQWNGSFKLDKASIRTSVAKLDNFEFNASHKNAAHQTSLTLTGPLLWQQNKGLQSSSINLTTLQDTVNRLPNPRFISQLTGSFNWNGKENWQGDFKGTFDRQPLALAFKYQTTEGESPLLEAGVALQKLSLLPYWDDIQANSGSGYPTILDNGQIPQIDANIKIGNVQIPGLQLDNIETLLNADKEHIALSHFKAGLYGGQTEGGISMANTTPPTYHLQQDAQNVQIRPLLQDLFGFHSFSGNGDAVIDLTARGNNRKQLIQSLQGMLTLNILNGAWKGIDINHILKNGISAQHPGGEHAQTPFNRFTLNSEIDKGISHHINTELFSEHLYIVSNGYTDLNTQELSEDLLIRNTLNPSAKPIPLKIRGNVANPSVTLDYNRITHGLNNPKEKQKALEQTLREQWHWLNPERKQADK